MEIRNMKILITTELYKPAINGVVTSVVTLKEQLESMGHEVKVLTLAKKHTVPSEDVYAAPSYSVGKIYPGARFALSSDEEIIEAILSWEPDIIHTQCEFSTFRMAKKIAKERNIPIVHTYHTVYEDYTHYFSPRKTWGKKIVSVFSKRVLKNTDAVIVPTQKVRHLLEDYGVTQPIHVIPTGIHLEKFDATLSTQEKVALRKKFGIPTSNHLLVAVGRLAKEKNLDEILQYMAYIKDPSLSLLIAGDGPHREKLEEFVQENGLSKTVHFAGMIDPNEVNTYYQLADVFVSASTSETQGLTYVEAMASGLPVLCRKDECLNGVLIEGENGYSYQSFTQFEERLYSLLLDAHLRNKLADQAKHFAHENYSSQRFAEKVEDIYNDVLHPFPSFVQRFG
jgi:1,2-diacylglycerol 3-alpha-glucosyltransferase